MAMMDAEARTTLKTLVDACRDDQRRFRDAAGGLSDRKLQRLFSEYSAQRSRFADELQSEVHRLGGQQRGTGTMGGTLHRGWMNVKRVVTGNGGVVLSECRRGEDSTKEKYQEALTRALPARALEIVERQYTEIQEVDERLRALDKSGTVGEKV